MPGEAKESPFGSQRRSNGITSGVSWEPEARITVRVDHQLLGRLDAYCELANRSRASAVRHLVAVALRRFEEEVDHGQNPRPG